MNHLAHPIRSCQPVLRCAVVLALAAPLPALALQPLSEFIAGAARSSTDQREALLSVAKQEREAQAALGRTIPAFSFRAIYTRNQSETKIDLNLPGQAPISYLIQPLNQIDGFAQLDIPIVDVSAWARIRAANDAVDASRLNAEATFVEVQKAVARSYYQLVGARALWDSAQRTLAAAQQSLALTRERQQGGVATELDVFRANAEVERAKGSIADAELTSELARRALWTLTGIQANDTPSGASDDLREEGPLEAWEAAGREAPAVRAAAAQRLGAEATARAAKFSLVPAISGMAQEHFTNAPGFVARGLTYTFNATLNWRLDLTTWANMRSQEISAEISRVREDRARQAALDRVHEAWQRVRAGIVKSRSARAAAESAEAAVARARERYAEGAGTHFELVQAERDAFGAEVSRIQADADLSYARAVLRLEAGRPLGAEANR